MRERTVAWQLDAVMPTKHEARRHERRKTSQLRKRSRELDAGGSRWEVEDKKAALVCNRNGHLWRAWARDKVEG